VSDSSLTRSFLSTMPHVSEDARNSLLLLLDSDLSTREVGVQLGVGHMMVSRVRTRARPCVQKGRGERPAKLKATDKRRLVRMITLDKTDNAAQLTQQLRGITNMECNPQTVCHALKEVDLEAAQMKKKPRL